MDKKLLEILACPVCKGDLIFNKSTKELVCIKDKIAFPIVDNIPVLLESDARPVSND